MKVLVVLVAACLASSQAAYSSYNGPLANTVVNPNGFLADTPEVAAAKAAHFSEVAKVSSPAGYAPGPYNGAPAPAQNWNAAPAAPTWNAAPQWNAAPAAPAWNAAPATPTWNAAPAWNGAPAAPAWNAAPAAPAAPAWNAAPTNTYAANPSVNPSGFLADTPEIAAAKAAHFAELAKVRSQGSAENYDDGSYRPEYDNPAPAAPAARAYNPVQPAWSSAPAQQWSAPAQQQWSAPAPSHSGHYAGPQATPVVTPQGFLADTPEVAAAKAAHFSEVARAGSHQRYRRSVVVAHAPLAVSPYVAHVAHPAPLVTYPYSHVLPISRSWGYSVRSW